MNSPLPPPPSDPRAQDPDLEEIVAYLDGELDGDAAQRIEQRLGDDPQCRRSLGQLQQVWDLLDLLPQTEVEASFTRTTLEMVAVQAADQVEGVKKQRTRRQQLRWCGAAAAVLATALGAFLVVTALLDRPNQQLVQDLPVIENADLYRHVDNLEFLRALDQAGLFDEEVEDAL